MAGPEVAGPSEDLVAGKSYVWVERVAKPTITVYPSKGRNTGVAVIIFPGGGYMGLAIDLEGTEVCDWLVTQGISCIVLKYRVPKSGSYWDTTCKCRQFPKAPMALQDAQRAVGLVRANASKWGIDPHKIGVLGFSAGGHLVADVSTNWEKRAYPAVDSVDGESCRPDFGVPIYPGHMLERTTKEFELNPTLPVSARTPPTLIIQAVDDPVDQVENSLVYFIALRKAGVPVEMHLYGKGGHAFGLRATALPVSHWPEVLKAWLGTIGMLEGK